MNIDTEMPRGLVAVLDAAQASLGVTGIYDRKPQDGPGSTAFPYVVYSVFPTMLDTSTEFGFRVLIRIKVYDQGGSKTRALGVLGGVYDLLHRQNLSVSGFNVYDLYQSESDCTVSADGNVRGLSEYVAYAEAE